MAGRQYYNVEGGEKLVALGRRLATTGPKLKATVRVALREAVKPVVSDIKSEIQGEDLAVVALLGGDVKAGSGKGFSARMTGNSGRAARYGSAVARRKKPPSEAALRKIAARSGLRAALAAGTGVTIGLTGVPSVKIRVLNTYLAFDQKGLPKAIEDGRWRHPVFGHNTWVEQSGEAYFLPPIMRHLPGIEAKVIAACDKIASAETRI